MNLLGQPTHVVSLRLCRRPGEKNKIRLPDFADRWRHVNCTGAILRRPRPAVPVTPVSLTTCAARVLSLLIASAISFSSNKDIERRASECLVGNQIGSAAGDLLAG